jgi:hypothetical protein
VAVNTYTTSDLTDLIKLLGHVPQSNATFTQANLLTLADLVLQTSISAQLKAADEGYWQTYVEYDQNDTGLYDLPSDAIASGTYSVQIRNGQAIWPVSKQNVGEMTTTTYPSVGNYTYVIQGNSFRILPSQFGGVLRVTYERRPSKLVVPTSCAQVSLVTGQIVSVSSAPSGWSVGDTLDLQAAQPQFNLLGECEITAINALDITVDGDLSLLSVGDYLCTEDQTCVPQIPVEFRPLLAQEVVCKIYELQGYMEKLGAAKKILEDMRGNLTSMITPRTQTNAPVINPSWGGRKPGSSWARFNPPARGVANRESHG